MSVGAILSAFFLIWAIAFETPKTVASSGMPSVASDSGRVSGKSMKDHPLCIQCKQRGYQHQTIRAFTQKIAITLKISQL